MRTRDGLLAGGVVVAIILSVFALLSRPGDPPEPPGRAAPPAPEAPPELQRRLAAVESRARRIEDALDLLEKRIADLGSRERAAPAADAGNPPAPVAVDIPEVVRDLGLEDLIRDHMGRGARHITLGGGGDPTGKLAEALDLTADQRARVREILDEFKGVVDEKLPAGRGGNVVMGGAGGGTTDALRELQAELKGRIAKVLDDEQRKKLEALVAAEGLPIAGTNAVWHFRETPGGGVAVTSTSVRGGDFDTRIEIRTDDAGAPPPPPAGGGVGDPDGVF